MKNLWVFWSFLKEHKFCEKLRKKQTTFVYCTCGNELTSSNSFISDTLDGVKYKCKKCGRNSTWNFDIFPLPVDITDKKYPSPREMGLKNEKNFIKNI